MTVGASDPKRARAAPGEPDRVRASDTIRRCGRDGLLSSREVEERIEHVFRARTMAELDAVVAGAAPAPHVAADVLLTYGIRGPAPKPERPWWRGLVAWTVLVNLGWIALWLIFGGPAGWLVLAIAMSATVFLMRLVSRHRKLVGKRARRARHF